MSTWGSLLSGNMMRRHDGAMMGPWHHYNDVIMSTMASQITSASIVYSTICSGPDKKQTKKTHQSSASLAFVRGIRRWPVNSPHKGPGTRKMFPFDDVIIDAELWWCFSLVLAWTSCQTNSPVTGDLRHHNTRVMSPLMILNTIVQWSGTHCFKRSWRWQLFKHLSIQEQNCVFKVVFLIFYAIIIVSPLFSSAWVYIAMCDYISIQVLSKVLETLQADDL